MSESNLNDIREQVTQSRQVLNSWPETKNPQAIIDALHELRDQMQGINNPNLRHQCRQLLNVTIEQLNQGQPSPNHALETIRHLEALLLHSMTDLYG